MNRILESERAGRVLHLTLNRPEKRNALNADLCRALISTIEDASHDPSIGAILLTAAGKSFCAGMDLTDFQTANPDEINALHEQLFTLGVRITKPLIAAVQGAALGGGTGLVANFHIVIAAEDATFGLTEIRLGLWPFLIFRAVTAAIGERRTVELALTGRIFPAAEAHANGLAHEVATDLAARAQEVAQTVASYSPTSIRAGLKFVQEVRGCGWKEAGEIARRIRAGVFDSDDLHEGIQAFREKRPPKWPSLR